MSTPEIIKQLVETFAANLDAYKSGAFNEAQARIQFINPMLTALGWDVSNRAGYAEAYKDVIHEDSLRIGSAVKAPDYCCRIGGARKFFVEAKKPFVKRRAILSQDLGSARVSNNQWAMQWDKAL